MKHRRILSGLAALMLAASLPMSALAREWDIADGDITIVADNDGQKVSQGTENDISDDNPVIIGNSATNTVSIVAEKDQTANVTLSGANIDGSTKGNAAVSTTGEGNVSIELDGDSTLKSGFCHAGLEKNNGGSLTIADEDKNGKLTAEGGSDGAGIGGGFKGNGNNIAITGGEVNATSNGCGAGIGGGGGGDGSDITVSGAAKLKVQGGVEDSGYGAGAGIGNGGNCDERAIPVTGAEVVPDTSGLTTNGSIEYYAPGADMEKDKPEKTTVGTLPPPEKPVEPGKPTEPAVPEQRGADAPLYRVTDQDGKDIAHKAERKDGVLTVTVDADFAILTGKLSSIDTLKRQGVEKIVFVTNKAASTFQAADLLEKGASSDAYRLTHDGATVTFVVSEKKTDVSGILIQP